MENFKFIIYLIILLIVTFTIVYWILTPSPTTSDLAPTPIQLNTTTTLLSPSLTKDTLLASAGSTLFGFINLQDGNKTQTYNDSFIGLLGMNDGYMLEVSPVPVSKGTSKAYSARLHVTMDTINGPKDEMIMLPPILLQKWTFICILRDGRRFDVMYDGEIVASHRLQYYPLISSRTLTAGSPQLNGTAVNITVSPSRLSPYDVDTIYSKLADTNGEPHEGKSISLPIPTLPNFTALFSSIKCLPGLPCDNITQPPQNKQFAWSTPYA